MRNAREGESAFAGNPPLGGGESAARGVAGVSQAWAASRLRLGGPKRPGFV